jgi:hypothetical protein
MKYFPSEEKWEDDGRMLSCEQCTEPARCFHFDNRLRLRWVSEYTSVLDARRPGPVTTCVMHARVDSKWLPEPTVDIVGYSPEWWTYRWPASLTYEDIKHGLKRDIRVLWICPRCRIAHPHFIDDIRIEPIRGPDVFDQLRVDFQLKPIASADPLAFCTWDPVRVTLKMRTGR